MFASNKTAEARLYYIDVDLLDGTMIDVSLALFTAAVGFSDEAPVRGFVAGAFVSGGVDKCFYKPQARAHAFFPIAGEPGKGFGKHMRCEIRNHDPRQDEKAAVADDPVQVCFTLRDRPSDIVVPYAELERRGAEGKRCNRAILNENEIFEPMPQEPLIAEIVMLSDKIVPHRFET